MKDEIPYLKFNSIIEKKLENISSQTLIGYLSEFLTEQPGVKTLIETSYPNNEVTKVLDLNRNTSIEEFQNAGRKLEALSKKVILL